MICAVFFMLGCFVGVVVGVMFPKIDEERYRWLRDNGRYVVVNLRRPTRIYCGLEIDAICDFSGEITPDEIDEYVEIHEFFERPVRVVSRKRSLNDTPMPTMQDSKRISEDASRLEEA